MKFKALVGLGAVFLLACATAATLTFLGDPQRRRLCPYGHSHLKTVDLIYFPRGSIRLTNQQRDRLARREAFLAPYSDVDPSRLPRTTVYCTQCGFVLIGGWTREADDPSGFTQPFSNLIQTFPLPEQRHRTSTKYIQDLHEGFVICERLDFKTTVELSVLKAQVRKWADIRGLELDPPDLPEVTPYRLYPAGKLLTEQVQSWGYGTPTPAVTGHVEFVYYAEESVVLVDLVITAPRSAKQSIDQLMQKRPTRPPTEPRR